MSIARDLPTQLPAVICVAGAAPLLPHALVRYLPGRRAVLRGEWNGRAVYAKWFFGKHASRHALRDQRGVEWLTQAQLATPALLHSGTIADSADRILIFAEMPGQSVETLWPDLAPEQRFGIARQLVTEVARHHRAGLMQTDLYLKNFLLHEDHLVTLDGDGVRRLPVLRAAHAAWQNLALLLSKFEVDDQAQWLPPLLEAYCGARDCKPMALDKLKNRVERERHRVIDHYAEHKVFRACSDVSVSREWGSFSAQMRDAFAQPLTIAQMEDALRAGHPLKRGNTCTVTRAMIGDRKVVVKRYNIKHWLHGVGRLFRRSRASVSWANAHRLRMHGIATAMPLALVERRFGPCRLQAYFVADYIEAPDMASWMADRAIDPQDKETAAMGLARLMHRLRLLQIAHGDMKATNLHVHGVRPILIDLDSMRHVRCRRSFERRHVRDLQRLLRNWADRPHIQRMVARALQQTYGGDPLLQRAGVVVGMNSENR